MKRTVTDTVKESKGKGKGQGKGQGKGKGKGRHPSSNIALLSLSRFRINRITFRKYLQTKIFQKISLRPQFVTKVVS